MSSAHHAIFAFHQDHVALGKPDMDRLRRLRDLNIERLSVGLAHLGRPAFVTSRGQGGYAMATLTRRDDGEQDIDVALIFNVGDLPARPADARALVYEAVVAAAPERFRRPPERRTNAVTVWYAGGYHIDFAIYRTEGSAIEHAGATWEPSSPAATVDWFVEENRLRSPEWCPGALVRDSQLRRVVRYMKFLRHGDREEYPGGFIITALACQNYVPRADGDDLALAATLARASQHIDCGRDLPDPVVRGRSLLKRQKDLRRLQRYGQRLAEVLAPLQPLFSGGGRRVDPVAAWERAIGFELPIRDAR